MQQPGNSVLSGNGNLEELRQLFNWSATPLGDPAQWPQNLRTAISEKLTTSISANENGKPAKVKVRDIAYENLNNTFLQTPYALCILRGPEFVIELANEMALELWDRKTKQVINKTIKEAFPELAGQGFIETLTNVYTTGKKFISNESLVKLTRRGKPEDAYINFVYIPLRNIKGEIDGIMGAGVEITVQVELRKKMEEAEQRLRLANEAARMGTFDWDLANQVFIQSPRLAEIFGFKDHTNITHKDLIDVFHPEDLVLRNHAVAESFEKGSLEYDARVIWPDRSIHWVRVYGKTIYNDERKPLRMYGTVQDITGERTILKLLEEGEQRSRLAIEAAQLATFDWDMEANSVNHSTRLAEIFGFFGGRTFTRGDLVKNIHPEDRHIRDKAVEESLKSGLLYYEARIIWPDTSVHSIKTFGKIIYDENKKPLKTYGIVQDITKEKEAVKLLADSEDRLRIALDSAELGTWYLHLNPTSIFYSPRLAQIFGYSEFKTLSNEEFRGHIHPADLPVVVKAHQDAFTTGVLSYEVRIVWKDNTVHWIRSHGKTLYNDKNEAVRMLGIVMDITRQKEAIKELEESEQRLRLATESAALGTFDLDLITSKVIVSQRYLHMLGHNENIAWEWNDFYERLHRGDINIAKKALDEALTTGVLNYVVRILWKDGSLHWVRKNGKVLYGQNGAPARMIGTLMDITEERTAIAALKESELLFKIISGTAPVGLWLTDTTGSCVFVNETWIKWTGEPLEKNLGAGWLSKVPPEDISQTKDRFTDALVNRKYFSAAFRLINDNKNIRWCLTEGFPYYGVDGEFAGFVGSVTDITERKTVEKELERKVEESTTDLKRSEERNYKMINEIQDYAIILLNKEGIIQNWNKGAQKIKGYKDEEIVGKSFTIFYTEEDRAVQLPEKLIAMAIEQGRAATEGWRVRKNGSRFWASIIITALHDESGNIIGFTKVTRDLTERKIVEEERQLQTKELSIKNYELHQQKEFVDVILDSSVDIISVFDTELRYISVNKCFEELYNVKRQDIIGKKVSEVFAEEKVVIFLKNLEKALLGESIHGFVHQSPITGKHYESFFIPLKNNGEVYAVLAVAHDNTDIIETAKKLEVANHVLEEKTADLQRTNTALEKSNSELEQYAYVASHDLQEPLRKIRTYSGILNENLQGRGDVASMATLQKVISAATRMSGLIYDLLNFSRLLNPEIQFEKTGLDKIFQNIISDFELVIEQKQAIIQVTPMPLIEAVPLQMNQLFYNLLNNALKFSKENVPPDITISVKHLTASDIKRFNNLDNSLAYIDVTVEDKGIGFSQQYAEQIFEVFKRLHTKQAYQGSGIGLALCRRIVLNHHGDMYAEGKENKGSAFHVILPVNQPKVKHANTTHDSIN